jgi:hypothetical protein
MRFAFLGKPKAFQQYQFVSREAVVQLADLDVFWSNPSLVHSDLSRLLGHAVANKIYSAL